MNVNATKKTIKNLPPRISVLLESNHGLGKSEVMRQIAQELSMELNKTFGFIDFRLAQCEVPDIIGMMRHVDAGEVTHTVFKDGVQSLETRTVKNVTLHDTAEWFPTDPDSCGILFLDELTRAPRDIQNAVMELALDYRYHFKELPIGWRVVAAVNENMDIYQGTIMDPALYDRFLKIKFKPTIPEWLEYAESIGCHKAITTYINKFGSDLMPEKIEPGVICPTPRSWILLSKVITYMADHDRDPLKDPDYLTLLSGGYLGSTISINFVDYIKKNYKVHNGSDLVNNFPTYEEEFRGMVVTEIAFYSSEIVKYVKNLKKPLTNKQHKNLLLYMKTIPKEAASGFYSNFLKDCRDLCTKWFESNH
jgi:hypothetical protein